MADRTIRLTIPGKPPSKANLYRCNRRGQFYSTGAVKEYVAEIEAVLDRQRVAPLAGSVSVEYWLYPPDARSDLTGAEKLVLDALQAERMATIGRKRRKVLRDYAAYVNDKQVRRCRMEWGGIDKENPRIEITVKPWRKRAA